MRLIITEIPEDGLEEDLDMSLSLGDVAIEGDVHVSFKALRLGDKVLVNGNAETKASLTCSRCLKEFLYPINVAFEAEYVPLKSFYKGVEYELKKEDLDVSFYERDEIDIKDLVREHLLLTLPMKPLCMPECRGFCQRCGKDLNEGFCGCETEEIDPRLVPLESLKRRLLSG